MDNETTYTFLDSDHPDVKPVIDKIMNQIRPIHDARSCAIALLAIEFTMDFLKDQMKKNGVEYTSVLSEKQPMPLITERTNGVN